MDDCANIPVAGSRWGTGTQLGGGFAGSCRQWLVVGPIADSESLLLMLHPRKRGFIVGQHNPRDFQQAERAQQWHVCSEGV